MSDFLMIGGARVPIAAPSGADEEYQEIGGEVVRSFSGRLLSTVKGSARVWRLQTPPLPESEAQMLAAVLAHGSPLLCSGALIGSDPVSCYARGVRTRPVAPLSRLRRVVEFELHEAAPAMSPILFRLHADRPLPAGMTFSRASTATYIDRDGLLRQAAANVPRIDWSHGRPALRLEGSSTNQIRNPRGEGAVVGVVGSGGALPRFWGLNVTGGLTWEVVGTGVEDGISYVDVRLHGTPTQTFAQMYFEDLTTVAAAAGETWTGSVFARLVAGSLTGIGATQLRIQERSAGGTVLDQDQTTFDPTDAPRLGMARRAHTRILASPNTAAVVLLLRVDGMTVGNAVDVTFRIGAPQLERSAVASSLILPPSGSPAASSRALDILTASWAHGLISFTGYARFIETGGAQLANGTVASWFGAGSGEILLRSSAATPTYIITVRDSRGVAAQVNTTPGVMTQVGQLVELMPQVEVSSQGVRARLLQAVDGGDPVASSWTDYVQADWIPTTVRLISRSGDSNQGQMDLLDLIVLRGADWTWDAVRRLVG